VNLNFGFGIADLVIAQANATGNFNTTKSEIQNPSPPIITNPVRRMIFKSSSSDQFSM
jgi:hypothetical protein